MLNIPELLNNFSPSVVFNSNAKTWAVALDLEDIKNLNPAVFSVSSMKTTELAVTITPILNAQTNQGSSSAYLNNLSFAVIPEPSSFSLLLVGGAVLVAGRRRKQD